ncbi:hypothetical protein CYMTET_47127 [Cymbomonas tetramitiformis]|uniref:Tektin n=1 Tax=Cymbomonas tetramitiformis TaxID=36881 RepID=A0AAE0BUR1_9CHLO|nr:hypothetical protein CYMTET_47127 [Cymbomonas tetramitiformis]
MPGSVAGLGHDVNGVNLQNLRSASSTTGFKTMGGFRPPFDWHRESAEHMNSATLSRTTSNIVRDHSQSLQNAFEQRAHHSQMSTQEALKSKMGKVGGLKNLLSETLDQTVDELTELQKVRSDLEKALHRKSKQLDLNNKRLQMRAMRPDRELVSDEVQSKLNNQTRLLQGSIEKVSRCIKNTDQDVERLREAREMLDADISDKDAALNLDNAALTLTAPDLSLEGNLQKKALAYPHNWCKNTEQGVQEARSRQNDAVRLRMAIERALEEAEMLEKQGDQYLQDAFREKTRLTEAIQNDLQSQRDAVLSELGEAKNRKASLEKAIADKKEPLALARQRYQMRKQRPSRELVHDEVEDALTQEFKDLQVIVQNLEAKLKQVKKEIDTLESNKHQLELNIKDKAKALSLDKQCIQMEVSSQASAASTRASQAALLQSKIAAMEAELQTAKSSRENMEDQMRVMKQRG